jgi:hypothetical protein
MIGTDEHEKFRDYAFDDNSEAIGQAVEFFVKKLALQEN